MSSPHSSNPRDRLLADTAHADWSEGPLAALARQAAAHARRRRRQRRALTVGGAMLAAALVLLWARPRPQPRSAPEASLPVAVRGYDLISDDELQVLLGDRPVLVLPQENHAPRIVLLER